MGKAFDDRAALAIITQVLKRLSKHNKNKNELYVAGTVQEELGMRGAPPEVKRIARNAALINVVTAVGGWFYAGHWVMGLVWSGVMVFGFVSILFGIGLIIVPIVWLTGIPAVYVFVQQRALQSAIWDSAAGKERGDVLDDSSSG